MTTVYFTCGQTHVHRIRPGVIWDKDGLLKVTGPTYDACTDYVFDRFGTQFSSDYPEMELPRILPYFKKGIIDEITL